MVCSSYKTFNKLWLIDDKGFHFVFGIEEKGCEVVFFMESSQSINTFHSCAFIEKPTNEMSFIAFCLLFAFAYCQVKPIWPSAFSASVFVHGWGERHQERHFIRWFFDKTAGMERVDGQRRFHEEDYFTTFYLNAKNKMETFVVYQPELVECWIRPTNHSLPHPDFTRAHFVGKAMIDYQIVNHWLERSHDGRDVNSIFTLASNGEIKRIDHHDEKRKRVVQFMFHEFDAGSQDPSLWVISPVIMSFCNNVTTRHA